MCWVALHALHRGGLLLLTLHIAWSVYLDCSLCVDHMDVSCNNGWTNSLVDWLRWAQETTVKWASRSLHVRGNFGELSGPLKSIGSFCCGVCSERGHLILMTWQSTVMLLTGRCHFTLAPWNNPLRLWRSFSSEFCYHLSVICQVLCAEVVGWCEV